MSEIAVKHDPGTRLSTRQSLFYLEKVASVQFGDGYGVIAIE